MLSKDYRGFSKTIVLILLVLVVGLGGVYGWAQTNDDEAKNAAPRSTSDQTKQPANNAADLAEGGKYLYIQEWSVRVALPTNMQGKVTYSLDEPAVDPSGNQLQSAKVLVTKAALSETMCETVTTTLGDAVNSGIQYIRSEVYKSFDSSRYSSPITTDILKDAQYAYHLNYLTPSCIGADNEAMIEQLQTALTKLSK